MAAGETINAAIARARSKGRPALVGYVTAGFPTRERFRSLLREVAAVSDVVEIGVPFSDPMADGPTIQRSSRIALEQGTTLRWILEEVAAANLQGTPLVLMSYLNPLLAYGIVKLPTDAARAGISGFIVPDLPYEECADLKDALGECGLALVQLVTPVTPIERLQMLCNASAGFVYAVTMTGTTGKHVALPQEVLDYFDRVRKVSPVPVCAGFGIRSREQVERMAAHVDGVVVASALMEAIERGEDPGAFLSQLRSS
jgi:tryptophan synthase alpha chain